MKIVKYYYCRIASHNDDISQHIINNSSSFAIVVFKVKLENEAKKIPQTSTRNSMVEQKTKYRPTETIQSPAAWP